LAQTPAEREKRTLPSIVLTALFAARSLPPEAIGPRLPDHGLLAFGVASSLPVLARLVAPWFGQSGGGLVFRLAGDDSTVRDRRTAGRLR
jgi:Tuberculosis necrotizing toxin